MEFLGSIGMYGDLIGCERFFITRIHGHPPFALHRIKYIDKSMENTHTKAVKVVTLAEVVVSFPAFKFRKNQMLDLAKR